jgi:hypothetical protein
VNNPLIVIEPPYLDSRSNFRFGYYGAQSLTSPVDPDSLINKEVENIYLGVGDTDKPIVAILDQNYTASVTIRDIIDLQTLVDDTVVTSADQRKLRVVVELIPLISQNNAVVKNVILPPQIAKQSPAAIEVAAGDPLFLAVQAYGGNLSYEWFTTAESGAAQAEVKETSNGTSLSIASVTAADAGTYTVRISNSAGVVESAEMVVTVSDAPVEQTWYDGAVELDDGWRYLDWFKSFKPVAGNWIYHDRLGWIYVIAEDTSSLYLWDNALGRWMWTSNLVYPWLYSFGEDAGWLYFFEDGTPGNRTFGRGDTGAIVSEEDL